MTERRGTPLVGNRFLWPFVLITSLFFVWGMARAILDVLNKHVQETLSVSKGESALLQVTVYGAYFLMALPAGWFIRNRGTRTGVVVGLLLFAAGAFLFVPSGWGSTFYGLLLPLFVIGCGLVMLEVAANPYAAALGDPLTAAGRLNRAQSFNGLGSIVGALAGGLFFFTDTADSASRNVAVPYVVLGVFVLLVALCFVRLRLPEVVVESDHSMHDGYGERIAPAFYFGLFALFCYEVSEITINTFFINFVSDSGYVSPFHASLLLSFGGLGLFMAGRFAGSALMRRVAAERLLAVCAVGALVCMACVMAGDGWLSVGALVACYVFESIMFPTVFALSLGYAGERRALASSLLMLSVVGGAVGPLLTGHLADAFGLTTAFAVPMVGFAVVLFFAMFSLERGR